MNEEDKIIINSFKFYDRDELEDLTKEYYLENQQLKEQLQQKECIIDKAKEKNKQIIKDTKSFYRPTSDRIYSGDCLIELATENIEILDNKEEIKKSKEVK